MYLAHTFKDPFHYQSYVSPIMVQWSKYIFEFSMNHVMLQNLDPDPLNMDPNYYQGRPRDLQVQGQPPGQIYPRKDPDSYTQIPEMR